MQRVKGCIWFLQVKIESKYLFLYIDCDCDENGSKDNICNKTTGICSCEDRYSGDKCNLCIDEYFGYPHCTGKINVLSRIITSHEREYSQNIYFCRV